MPQYGKVQVERGKIAPASQIQWQSRVGLAPNQRDSMGPGWVPFFQGRHIAVIDEIDDRCAAVLGGSPRDTTYDVRARGDLIEGRLAGVKRSKFVRLGSVVSIEDAARKRSRY